MKMVFQRINRNGMLYLMTWVGIVAVLVVGFIYRGDQDKIAVMIGWAAVNMMLEVLLKVRFLPSSPKSNGEHKMAITLMVVYMLPWLLLISREIQLGAVGFTIWWGVMLVLYLVKCWILTYKLG